MISKSIPRRRKITRLPFYDYSQPGAYFVTIITYHRLRLFSDITNGTVALTRRGQIVDQVWNDLVHHYQNLELDEYVIMPNHIHGIIRLLETDHAPDSRDLQKPTHLPEIIRLFKSFSARMINEEFGSTGLAFWQRNYYEHIIRNDEDFNRIRGYIIANPVTWFTDEHFTD